MGLPYAWPSSRTSSDRVANRPRRLLIGEGAGIGPTLFLAEQMRAAPVASADAALAASADSSTAWTPLVLLGSDTPFPFRPRPSVIVVPGIPTGVIACMPLLEEWGIPSRLASTADLPGCFEGTVTDLADAWLSSLSPADLAEVEILSCGPAPILEATAALARRHDVPCQTSSPDVPTAHGSPPAANRS
jgi:dihydroorotate dehydrogenase electron transfer subunit